MNLLAGRSLKKHVPMDRATAQVTFYFDSKRRRDPDNALAAMKAAFDGMVDAKIIADDSRLVHLPVIMLIDRESPRVVIEVTGE
jgi:Holliday junction resolvase RusA-like endonuclease